MPISNDVAISETRALARSLGIDCEPIVLADKSNLVMHLAPHPIVARAAMATSMVRVGMEWLRREVEITRHLAARGGSVTRPSITIDAGPFERGGLVVSFWELEDLSAAPIDARLAGARLADAHRLLRDFPREQLPAWGAWTEAREVLARARTSASFSATERLRVERATERAERIVELASARSASLQPVHGDAHVANVLSTERGPVWGDWEDAFVGPIEWDLACLRSRLDLFGEERAAIEATLDAYDVPHDPELVRALGLVRNVAVIGWCAVFAERQPELLPRMRARIAHLPT